MAGVDIGQQSGKSTQMPYISPKTTPRHSHATGTMIRTAGGQKPVEALQPGDLVCTRDNGLQPVRWIASRRLDAGAFAADASLRPVRIRANALGENRPVRDLVVSQQHCLLIDDWRCQLLFGEDEVLAPAIALLNDSSVTIDRSDQPVTYYHFMFDRHEIVYSNGVATESFHPDFAGIPAMDRAKSAELFRLFPQLKTDPGAYGPKARATLHAHEVEVLMAC
ncbi:MAG: Hint domain-containing protein [Rhodobacter sp.]|nr:Hint domain-containing protein [Rhodobacter sp.]